MTAVLRPVSYRFNHNSAPSLTPKEKREKYQADNAKLHDALRDWQAPILTYEELKPRTESPDPVCIFTSAQSRDLIPIHVTE